MCVTALGTRAVASNLCGGSECGSSFSPLRQHATHHTQHGTTAPIPHHHTARHAAELVVQHPFMAVMDGNQHNITSCTAGEMPSTAGV